MLSLSPQNINEDTWYYEEGKGIRIIHWTTDQNGQRRPIDIKIGWKKLENSLKRKKKSLKTKKK